MTDLGKDDRTLQEIRDLAAREAVEAPPIPEETRHLLRRILHPHTIKKAA